MKGPDPTISLDQLSDAESFQEPVFLRIARAISADIARGRFRPGQRLPSSRALADSLGVHRNTVLAAYQELIAEGWLVTRPSGGTFVSSDMVDTRPKAFARSAVLRTEVPGRVGFDLAPPPDRFDQPEPPKGALVFASGMPDLRLAPVDDLSRAYRRALRQNGGKLLGYGDPAGELRLRSALASMFADARGLAANESNVIVTRGSQMAIDLCAKVLFSPGDVVAVEALGYQPAWAALRASGARLVPVAVDRSGMVFDALRAVAERERLRAIYLTPHHQYPTTVSLSPGRRLQVLELAAERRIAVIEDDYDNEFHYESRPILPLASADRKGTVLYIGTLSKILAPALRVGFLVAPEPFILRAAAMRATMDRQGDRPVETAVAELIEDGAVQRHVRRMRGHYAKRREALAGALARHLGAAVRFDLPQGGMAIWVEVDSTINVEKWAENARAQGVIATTAKRFAFDGRARNFFRLGFANLNEKEIEEGVLRLKKALRV
ncbi:MAG: PLP-dependent aminotransferase family protein [Polyangiaceae bacterium]|nr:PLP-dependent aminotransferase family protein [Polyangiaceae bacterium]